MNKYSLFVAIFLVCLGALICHKRSDRFDLSMIPSFQSEYWQVKAELVISNKNGLFRLEVPSDKNGSHINNETFSSKDEGIAIFEKEGRRIISTRIVKSPERSIDFKYSSVLKSGTNRLKVPENLVLPKRLYVKKKHSQLASDFIKQFENEKLDLVTAEKVRNCFVKPNCQDSDFLKFYKTRHKSSVTLLAGLLRKMGYELLIAKGFDVDQQGKAVQPVHWLRVKINNKYYDLFLPLLNGKTLSPDKIIFWNYLDEDFTSLENGFKDQLVFSVERVSAYENTELEKYADQDSLWGLLSLKNVPLEVQSAYRYMLLIPLGSLLIAFYRNVLGFSTFGTFMPVLVSLALIEIGLSWGLVMFAFLLSSGLLIRHGLYRLRLLLVPRLAACLSFVILLIVVIGQIAYEYGYNPVVSSTLFPIVVITLIIERMAIVVDERGFYEMLRTLFSSMIASLLVYFIAKSPLTQYVTFEFPETSLIIIGLLILLGGYRGYRLSELTRFKILAKS